MKILVIGGSYFLGRAFTMIASKQHELTLVNRGTVSMRQHGYPVSEYKMSRRNVKKLAELPNKFYDAVVDFCGYQSGDVKLFLDNFPGMIKKYIFISTVDVYQRNLGYRKNEKAPVSTIRYKGEVGEYIYQKICLENEVQKECSKMGMDYTILRPSIIYGPNNYAPRESKFIQMIAKGMEIEYPKDATGKFQLVYVKDVAEAILLACKKTKSTVYNICPIHEIGYEELMRVLTKVSSMPVKLRPVSVKEALNDKAHLPFPTTIKETELYDGSKWKMEFNFQYTPLEEGMKKTFNAFKNVI